MAIRVGINGFGRIGRQVLRAAKQQGVADLDFVAVNDLTDTRRSRTSSSTTPCTATYQGDVTARRRLDHQSTATRSRCFAEKDPAKLPWKELGVDIVLESTGRFTEADDAKQAHRRPARRR